jgi:hypothetical protein
MLEKRCRFIQRNTRSREFGLAAVADWQRMLMKVFKLAEIKRHAHRFRDTLRESFEAGVSLENLSILLGHSLIRFS